MSTQHYRWAWDQSLPALEKLTLLALAERANKDEECYPSIARLAKDTGMNEKTAGAAVLALEKAGLIEIKRSHGHASTYRLRVTETSATTPELGGPPNQGDPQIRGTTTPELGGPTTPELGGQNPPYEPISNPPEESTAVPATPAPATDPPASTSKPRKRSLPDDFTITDGVRRWAKTKGYGDLEAHFESFCLKCQAKGYQYIDWDAAFKTAIRDDWAGLRRPPSHRTHQGGPRHEAYQRPLSAVERCRESAEEWARKRQEGNIIDLNDYRAERPGDSHAVDSDGGDLWPQVGIGAR